MQTLRPSHSQTYPQRLLVASVGVSGLFAAMAICSLSGSASAAVPVVALAAIAVMVLSGWCALSTSRDQRIA
ncbi:hypothetical protein [Sphingomonas sp. DT-51]|uniref:hypothetical protein n=1 Tax=Sphingomonas sp. DT-51 TaxID=3396165 RepID=UPI003F541D72